jgi:hypothetical protein
MNSTVNTAPIDQGGQDRWYLFFQRERLCRVRRLATTYSETNWRLEYDDAIYLRRLIHLLMGAVQLAQKQSCQPSYFYSTK